MILSDAQIRELSLGQNMIEPFVDRQVRNGAISYGLSSYGYDIRVASEFKVFSNATYTIVDPKSFDDRAFVDVTGDECIIPPNSFVLARSVEHFNLPRDVIGICLSKSSYARCGIHIHITPLEPGWRGFLTIEISNATPLPARVYANEGISQVIFFRGEPPLVSYAERNGKYQDQRGIVLPRL